MKTFKYVLFLLFAFAAMSCDEDPILRDGGDDDDDPIVNPPPGGPKLQHKMDTTAKIDHLSLSTHL